MVYGIFNFEREIYDNMDNFIANKLECFLELQALTDYDEIEQFYEDESALTLFKICNNLRRENCYIKIENLIFEDYLQTNIPLALEAIKKGLKTPGKRKKPKIHIYVKSSVDASIARKSLLAAARKSVMQKSMDKSLMGLSLLSMGKQDDIDSESEPMLNFMFRSELCQNICFRYENMCNETETEHRKQLLAIKANLAELQNEVQEISDIYEAFENTVTDPSDDVGPGRITSRNITPERIKFFWRTWMKNGSALLSTLRLKYMSLVHKIRRQQQTIHKKRDLIGTLLPVDIDLLQEEKTALEAIYESQADSLFSVKNLTARISSICKKREREVQQMQAKLKAIERSIDVIKNRLSKVSEEINYAQKAHSNEYSNLSKLKVEAKDYTTPSIKDYIDRKIELQMLKKEEKSLMRSTRIMQLKISRGNKKL